MMSNYITHRLSTALAFLAAVPALLLIHRLCLLKCARIDGEQALCHLLETR